MRDSIEDEYLRLSKFPVANSQYDGIWSANLWEVIRFGLGNEGASLMMGVVRL